MVAVADCPFVRQLYGKMPYMSRKSADGFGGLPTAIKGSVAAMSAPVPFITIQGVGEWINGLLGIRARALTVSKRTTCLCMKLLFAAKNVQLT